MAATVVAASRGGGAEHSSVEAELAEIGRGQEVALVGQGVPDDEVQGYPLLLPHLLDVQACCWGDEECAAVTAVEREPAREVAAGSAGQPQPPTRSRGAATSVGPGASADTGQAVGLRSLRRNDGRNRVGKKKKKTKVLGSFYLFFSLR